MGGFPFLRGGRGTSDGADNAEAPLGASRRELKEVMNSSAWGESPRRFLRCSAAASFDRLEL